MTAYGSIEHAVETLRLGAADYIRKPIEPSGCSRRLIASPPPRIASCGSAIGSPGAIGSTTP
ncbi:MAG: hypothetical protein IPK80_00765 [Nannocystis sp.]|nr:hypothetical protein [Nannocystis sp.]